MYPGLTITPPFFEIGPKAYLYGKKVLKLALHADGLSQEFGVQIIFTPQYVDIPLIARRVQHLLVFAQHMDALAVGRGVGSVLPEALKAAGAKGVLLNHTEKPLAHETICDTIQRADEVGLATLVCAGDIEQVRKVAALRPNILLAESPALIGTGRRLENDREEIERINQAVREVDPDVLVLHGAGISDEKDVYRIIASGAQGTGSTSGIILAEDPLMMLTKMIRAVREAWEKYH
jgi:triosephosphate isomerase